MFYLDRIFRPFWCDCFDFYSFFDYPSINVREGNNKVTVEVELPGFNPKASDVEITVKAKGRYFVVYGKKKDRGSFYKVISLPAGVDPTSGKGKYKDGILTVEFRKSKKEEKEILIEIE